MQHNSTRTELLRKIREREASLVAKYLSKRGRFLEVGAGCGYQAQFFQSIGFQVDAIDVENSRHIADAVFPIQTYNGSQIPFADASFDVVFSSNVLEHVSACEQLLEEMRRVLKEDGLMVHIVPTTFWRLWTSVTHYIAVVRYLQGFIRGRSTEQSLDLDTKNQEEQYKKHWLRWLRGGLLPFRHGVRGNWLTELYYFSRIRWQRTFNTARLQILAKKYTGLFYTGNSIPGPAFPMEKRVSLAKWLGSSTVLFVLEKAA